MRVRERDERLRFVCIPDDEDFLALPARISHFDPRILSDAEIRVDDELTIDFKKREVIVRGQHIKLRPTEYRMLYHLVSNAGYVLTHEILLAKVWGHEYRDESQYVRATDGPGFT